MNRSGQTLERIVDSIADVRSAAVSGVTTTRRRSSMRSMRVVELCRSCHHEKSSHRPEDGRCLESLEMLEGESGVDVAVPCDCPGWPGRPAKATQSREGSDAPAVSQLPG